MEPVISDKLKTIFDKGFEIKETPMGKDVKEVCNKPHLKVHRIDDVSRQLTLA